jgi:hypothetical protein
MSSLSNYILIHALTQHIFLVRQTSAFARPSIANVKNLKAEDIDNTNKALQAWQKGWEQTLGRSLEPPNDPVTKSSAALARLAYIHLHGSKAGPCRSLETRDPKQIAEAFVQSPLLARGPCINQAVLQAVHSLSIIVRTGINFAARTQAFSWTIEYSLCNAECAFLLSKWLQTIATTFENEPLSADEKYIIGSVRGLLMETIFAVPLSQDGYLSGLTQKSIINQLALSVVRVWAEIFKGGHVFSIVEVIGSSLAPYAEMLDSTGMGQVHR